MRSRGEVVSHPSNRAGSASRRQRLTTAVVLVAAVPALTVACDRSRTPVARRPNVLVLLSDDLRADATGFGGNSYVRTPHIDALAASGFVFRQTHIMGGHHAAVCAPSRAMILSGRSLFRVYDDLDSVDTLPQLLGGRGYLTFGTGKWHQSRTSFEKSFRRGRNLMFGGMSDHFRVPLTQMQENRVFTDPAPSAFSTRLFADAAVQFLEDYGASDREAPFFAWVAFTAPHDPRTPPPAYEARYSPSSVPLPPNFMPAHPFDLGPKTMTVRDEMLAPWPRTPEIIRMQTAEYYGLISHLDAEIGRILAALRRLELDKNTVIVFASDNGLALGSHGLLGKQSLYEHSTRVPLVVSGPGIPSGGSNALVYLHDLYATLSRLTGLEIDPAVESLDLAPIWRGERETIRKSLFSAYADAQRSIRDERWKLIHYPRIGHLQLFDLKRDPYELQNLASDPRLQSEVDRLRGALEKWRADLGDPDPLEAAVPDPFIFDYSGVTRTVDRHQPESIRRKYYDDIAHPAAP